MNAKTSDTLARIADLMESEASQERLPEDLKRYFTMPSGWKMVPLAALETTRHRMDGIERAAKLMAKAYKGEAAKREPVSLKANDDGTYVVLDGNSTVAVARQQGWKHIIGKVVEDREEASALTTTLHSLLEKMGGPEWKPGTLFKKGMSLPKGWRLAWGVPYAIKGGPVAQDASAKKAIAATRSMNAAAKGLEKATKEGLLPSDISVDQHVEIAEKFLEKHSSRLEGLQDDLKEIAPFAYKVKARVKTLDSALGKLVRKPKYKRADRLQDGTGARVICDTVQDVEKAVEAIRKKFKVIPPEDDYISKPLGGESGMGYRSHHLIIEDKDGLQKEVQVRTKNENTHADWSHDAYKPRSPEQAAARKKYADVIDKYARDASDYYFAKESGKNPDPVPCPVAIKDTFGCLPI